MREGWSGPLRPKILFLAEAWGEEEEKLHKPLVGSSGGEFWRMLSQVWGLPPELHRYGPMLFAKKREELLEREGIALTNVFNMRPQGNDLAAICQREKTAMPPLVRSPRIGYLRGEFYPHLDRLRRELQEARPDLIVALGATACWALDLHGGIGAIRGAIAEMSIPGFYSQKVLPTYHPAGVLRQAQWRPIVIADFMKAKREGEFPEVRRLSRRLLISPTIGEVEEWIDYALRTATLIGCDLETSGGMIDTVGLSRSATEGMVVQIGPHRHMNGAVVMPQRDGISVTSYFSESEEVHFWKLVKKILESEIPKVFQNGLFDLQYLLRMGIRPRALREDTMLLAHSLFPELPKGLGFLGSIYTNEAAWKLMRTGEGSKRDD